MACSEGFTLGLEPTDLNLTNVPQVQSPRVKPEGDDRGWGKPVRPTALEDQAS